MTVDLLRAQYEAYPYPARDPRDEDRRLITGSPSQLDQLNHYVFGGRLDFSASFRVLVAGGGTGDAAIMLGHQLCAAGVPAHITYLDLSEPSKRIAEARAARRGLTNIEFRTGSLLDAGRLGPFDYIDCCGVIHHLADPAAGLSALGSALAPGGGIGLMVYAPYGRAGVYPMQDALRTLTAGLPPAEQIEAARRVLRALPEQNGLRNNPLLTDHLTSDAGLYDLLLHSCDRAYTVPALAALATRCDLAITALIEPAQYDPASYVRDPKTLRRLDGLSWLERAAWAEQVGGALGKHIAYLVRPESAERAVARVEGLAAVPVLRDINGPELARGMRPGAVLDSAFPGLTLALPLPRLAGPILARADGRASFAEIFEAVRTLDRGLSAEQFSVQARALFEGLNRIGKMYLRIPG